MDFILDAIERASQQGHCFPAVVTALIVPDIAGAVDSPGAGCQSRYVEWVEKWFAPRFPDYAKHDIDGVGLYALRCKLLHEGLSDPSRAPAATQSAAATRKRLIAFNVDPVISMHLCTKTDANGETWTVLGAETFCKGIIEVARSWLAARKTEPAAMARLQSLVDVRSDVSPLSHGVQLIHASI
jgi:hypothetical protein